VSLLFTSLYSEHKNLGTLFRGVLKLGSSGLKFRLITTADPNWEKIDNTIRKAERKLADKLKGRGLLELTGVLADSALDAVYARADIFVYPSRVESFGHPLLEAMAAGLPIVAADVPINRELCGNAAVYFRPLDHDEFAATIKRIVGDPRLRRSLVERGFERLENFEWSGHVERLVQAFA